MASETITAAVTPSPFGDRHEASPAAVSVGQRQLWLTADGRTVALRPVRATLGYGTLHLVTRDPVQRLRLTFASYDVPKPEQQHAAHLSALFRELDDAGLRELLVSLREIGVRLRVSPRLSRGAGAHRLAAWVGACGLLFVELALFGVPAAVLGAIAAGGVTTSSYPLDLLVMVGLGGFLALVVTASPIPLLVRRSFEQGASRDPVRYLDTWAGRQPEARDVGPGQRLAFVPGVPVLPAMVLAAACVFYALRVPAAQRIDVVVPEPGPGGQLGVPEPSWLGGTAISIAGYVAMGLLLVVFVVGLIRWRQDPELYGMRWAPLVGAFVCFAFGQAGADLRLNPAEQWLYLVLVGMVVAFTCGRAAWGFGLLGAMTVFILLAGFGFFESWRTIVLLIPVFVLIGAIVLRYLPAGARLVPLSRERAARVRRLVWLLWAAAVTLGLLLAITAGQWFQVAP